MAVSVRDEVRNVAVVAHVDHGKTTVVDALLWQGRSLQERALGVLDAGREKALAVLPRFSSVPFRGTQINVVDLPSQTDLLGDVGRLLRLVDGALWIVDSGEGPLPQTRLVLHELLHAGLGVILVLTKIDLPRSRPAWARAECRRLLADLDASAAQLELPTLYCNARRGACRRAPDGPEETMLPLFEALLAHVPAPRFDPEAPLELAVTALDYDDFLGRLAVGRVRSGQLRPGQEIVHVRLDGSRQLARGGALLGYLGTQKAELGQAGPGDLVALAGLESVRIGDTLAAADAPGASPGVGAEEPTVGVVLEVNDSPLAGQEGPLFSGAKLRERLWRELLVNPAVRIETSDSPDAFLLAGRSELQLAILIQMMRREGYEFLVAGPRVLTRESAAGGAEPFELLTVDCPEPAIGALTSKLAARRGRMTRMVNHGSGRVRVEYRIPSRGLLGFRGEFLNETRGAGILGQRLAGYEPWAGPIPGRIGGSLVADRPGRATAHAIAHLQDRGALFVAPGDEVYEGMIVGEHSRPEDLEVNLTKQRRPGSAEDPRDVVRLIPPSTLSLEQALGFVHDDERVEVTPRALRLRKKRLGAGRPSF